MIPAADGLHRHVPEAEYHADRGSLSVSGAKLLLPPSCPAKFHEVMTNGQKSKKEWDFGHVAHRIVLGKGAEFKVLDPAVHGLKADGTPADKPTATGSWKTAAADARERGLIPIHIDDHAKAVAMAAKVHEHQIAGQLFRDGDAEVSLYCTDPETGVRLRGRVDWFELNGDIDDYKTSTTANPDELHHKFYKLSYFMQAAWYIDLAIAAGASTDPTFRFVVQEKEPPFEVVVVRYDADDIEEGRRRNREAIRLYVECMQSGHWPGYADDAEVVIHLPGYAFPHPQTLGEFIADSYVYDIDPLEEEYQS